MQSANQSLPESQSPVNPYLSSLIGEKRCQVSIRKRRCKHSWCSSCWDRDGKRVLLDRMRGMRSGHIRSVMLSVDREKFRSGEDAFNSITEQRGLGNFIRNLERTDGIKIIDWLVILQWHRDGFPHWHFIIEVEPAGRDGMIGEKILHDRWPFGQYIHEGYIRDENHWWRMLGYFNRHGYFEGDNFQNKLPLWALQSGQRIKRFETMKVRKNGSVQRVLRERSSNNLFNESPSSKFERRSNGRIIESCGMSSHVSVNLIGDSPCWFNYTVSVPFYILFNSHDWVYIKGRGLTSEMSVAEYRSWCTEFGETSEFAQH